MQGNLFILQGGGPTAVINASLAALIRKSAGQFDNIYGLKHSFELPTGDEFVNLSTFCSPDENNVLAKTPGSILGSSRKKISEPELERMLDLLRANRTSALVGIGGNGTMAVLNLLHKKALNRQQSLTICGVPKTVDNDLPGTYISPGFASAARFVALATRDFGYDFRAMATFDDVTIFETMGRDCGWLALASIALKERRDDPPHIVLIPERPTDEQELLAEIRRQHATRGAVFIVVNEQVCDKNGAPLGDKAQSGPKDGLGRTMWSLSSGVGNYLANLIWKELGLQTRCLRPGNLGRALSNCVSPTDRELAAKVGEFAIEQILNNKADGQMVVLDEAFNPNLLLLHEVKDTRSVPDHYIGEWPDRFASQYQEYLKSLIGPVDPLTPPLD